MSNYDESVDNLDIARDAIVDGASWEGEVSRLISKMERDLATAPPGKRREQASLALDKAKRVLELHNAFLKEQMELQEMLEKLREGPNAPAAQKPGRALLS